MHSKVLTSSRSQSFGFLMRIVLRTILRMNSIELNWYRGGLLRAKR
jgi:hypothetical protein